MLHKFESFCFLLIEILDETYFIMGWRFSTIFTDGLICEFNTKFVLILETWSKCNSPQNKSFIHSTVIFGSKIRTYKKFRISIKQTPPYKAYTFWRPQWCPLYRELTVVFAHTGSIITVRWIAVHTPLQPYQDGELATWCTYISSIVFV